MSGGKGVGGARSVCARTCLRVVVAAAVGAVLAEAAGVKRAVASVVLVVVLVLRWGSVAICSRDERRRHEQAPGKCRRARGSQT